MPWLIEKAELPLHFGNPAVRGKDYVYPGGSGGRLSNMKMEFTGCGPFLHNDPRDRPPSIFNGKVTLHAGGEKAAYVLLPIIPKGDSGAS